MPTFSSSALATHTKVVSQNIKNLASAFTPPDPSSSFKSNDIILILSIFFQRHDANGLYINNLLHKVFILLIQKNY